ncbi:MAG: lipase family protein [Gammaproteobacteria bacterium]
MLIEHAIAGPVRPPFPIHESLVESFLSAHAAGVDGRDATVAHALGMVAGYSYADSATLATMVGRVGLAGSHCTRISQTVDAMYIFATAYLVQSACGRVVILAFRGTELANVGNWLADVDVGDESVALACAAGASARVHAGFMRNLRAVRLEVLEHLRDPRMQALFVTGHSLGGALASLFALTLDDAAIADRLRAVYTFGQPLAVGGPLPPGATPVAARIVRHVLPRDPIPALPLTSWGRLEHHGVEYGFAEGEWRQNSEATRQMSGLWRASRSLSGLFASEARRKKLKYTLTEHGPHKYLAALRPAGRITEFGD